MPASGVILSGGRSSRMNFNKAFAEISGTPVLEIIINKLSKCFDDLMIITNEPELYKGMGPAVYTDLYPQMGPMAGIHAGLYYSRYESIFLLGCDMPFFSMELASYMLSQGADMIVWFQSLTGSYSPYRRCTILLVCRS
jgi:molybdopterin-guanine dinucleotide biosynthesis protein A